MFDHLLLRLGCLAGIAAGCYPLLWLCTIRAGRSSGLALLMTATLMLGIGGGFGLRLVLFRLERRRSRLVRVGMWLVAVGSVLLGIWLAPFSETLLAVVYGALLGGCVFAGTRLAHISLAMLSHSYVLVGICLADVALGLIGHSLDAHTSQLPLVGTLVGNVALYIVAQNTLALGRFLFGVRQQEQAVPQEVRRGNGRILGLFCLLCGGILLGYRPLAAALQWIGGWIGTGLWYLLRWMLGDQEETTPSDVPAPITQQVTQVTQNTAADWIWLAIWVVLVGGLVALIVWQRHAIWDLLQWGWRGLCRWVAQHFVAKSLPQPETAWYTEYTEDLLTQEKPAHPMRHRTRRTWRRAYRRYRQMPYGAQRYRLGYALLLGRLPEDVVRPADSPGEILEKLRDRDTMPQDFAAVTDRYQRVRYGTAHPGPADFEVLDAALKRIGK